MNAPVTNHRQIYATSIIAKHLILIYRSTKKLTENETNSKSKYHQETYLISKELFMKMSSGDYCRQHCNKVISPHKETKAGDCLS